MDKTMQLRVIAAMKDKLSAPLRKVRGTASASAQGVTELRDKLRTLNAAQRDIGAFRDLSRGLQTTKVEMAAAQQRVATLAQQLKSTESPTRAMTREFNQAVRAAKQLKDSHARQATELQRLRDNLTRAGVSTSNLGRDETTLRQRIDQTSQALARQTRQLQSAAMHQQKLAAAKDKYAAGRSAAGAMAGMGAGGLAAGGGALYAEAKFIAPGIQFDAAMSKVQALSRLEKDTAEMAAIRKQALDLGASTMFSATQAAEAQGFLAMAGFNPKAITDAMPGMLSLAKAGDTDLGQTADIGSNILTGFNLPAAQMGRVGDVLTAAFTRSNTSLYMLGETMKYVAPVAAGVGQDIETMAAAAGKLGDAGIQGSMGGTALRAIVGRLAAPPKAAAEALAELNIRTLDATGNLRDLPSILAEIDQKTKKMGTGKRAGIFKDIAGEEAFSGLQVLVAQAGSGELQKFVATLRQSAGEADKVAGTMADNMVGDLDELSSAWEDVGIHIQSIHDGALRELTRDLAGIVGQVKAWMVENPRLAKALTAGAAGVAALVAGLGALTLALASVLGPFVLMRFGLSMMGIQANSLLGVLARLAGGGFGLVANAIMMVSRALWANPIVLAVAAIAGAAFLLYRYWTPITAFLRDVWRRAREVFGSALGAITALLQSWNPFGLVRMAWGMLDSYFPGLWGRVVATVGGAVDSVSMALFGWTPMQGIAQAWNGVAAFFSGLWQQVLTAVDGGLAGVLALMSNWNPFALLYSTLAGAVSSLGVDIPARFTDLGRMLMEGLVSGVTSMASAVTDSVSGIATDVVDRFKNLLGIRSPSRVMMEMGGFVSEGAAVGITRHQSAAVQAAQALAVSVTMAGTPLPVAASLSAADAVAGPSPTFLQDDAPLTRRFDTRPPIQAARPTPPAVHIAGDTITIEINVTGGNPQDIARAIDDVLRRRDRDKAARQRSAYRDGD